MHWGLYSMANEAKYTLKEIYDWAVKQYHLGLSYDEMLELIISYRLSNSKSEKELYESFFLFTDEDEFIKLNKKMKDYENNI